ncbi:MAG: EAL domain-containing protein [Sulfuricellaceae bacterium]|nr:EAL domain-containing protein [Sulfuricellaceae bacterium]
MSTESQEIFIGRQPILDRHQNIVAYELLFRSSAAMGEANVSDDMAATANVITQAFGELGVGSVLAGQLGFINVSADLLLSEMIELLPRDQVVLELLETIEITDEIVARCRELKAHGFSFALDDFVFSESYEPLFELVDIVKLDVLALSEKDLRDSVKRLKHWPVKLLAEKIDNPQQASACQELGFDLYQGFFFAKPITLSGKRAGTQPMMLLKLLGLVMGDAELNEIEPTFKQEPQLSYSLLRLVNSVAIGRPQKIASLKQAIVVLGRRQLQRWLQLLLFAQFGGGQFPNPLMIMAANRGKLMELLAGEEPDHGKNYPDEAFMTGILSLLDTLLNINMTEIVANLSLPDEVKAALLSRSGKLGNLLILVETFEQDDVSMMHRHLGMHPHLKPTTLTQHQIVAMAWASNIGVEK